MGIPNRQPRPVQLHRVKPGGLRLCFGIFLQHLVQFCGILPLLLVRQLLETGLHSGNVLAEGFSPGILGIFKLLQQQFEYAEDAGAETFRKDIAALESNLEKLDEQEQKYSAALDAALHEYAEVKSQAAGLDPVELYEARQAIRLGQEAAANEKLEQVFGSKYSLLRWMDAKQAQIRLTNDSLEEYAARQQAKQKYKSISQPVRKRNHEQER